jgi:hypothetical protein
MSIIKVDAVVNESGGATATINGYTPTESNMAGRNRIINGDMRIDQRNAGASVTPASLAYTLDRWRSLMSATSARFSVQQNAGAVTPPTGFTNYLGVTSSSAHSLSASDQYAVQQWIEGFNIADLGWGTANAKAITVSFWVRSSLTGTFGGSLNNGAFNRSYPFSYTISGVNTWEQKTITIAGDTSGTWTTDNSRGVSLTFGLGVGSTYSGTAGAWAGSDFRSVTGATSVVGTSGATLYITGVQLEAGSVATPFERRQYGTELALCQRYFWMIFNSGSNDGRPLTMPVIMQAYGSSGVAPLSIQHIVPMRTAPSVTFTNPTDSYLNWPATGSVPINSSGHSIWGTNNQKHTAYLISYGSGSAAFVAGTSMVFDPQGSTIFSLSAEL